MTSSDSGTASLKSTCLLRETAFSYWIGAILLGRDSWLRSHLGSQIVWVGSDTALVVRSDNLVLESRLVIR